jgi:hypothetical protein
VSTTRPAYYVLDGDHRPIPSTLMGWAESMEKQRRVDLTDLPNGYTVSTVFLGLDHAFDDGPPVLFETMVFPEGPDGEYQERFTSWDAAKAGHADACLKAAERPAIEPAPVADPETDHV